MVFVTVCHRWFICLSSSCHSCHRCHRLFDFSHGRKIKKIKKNLAKCQECQMIDFFIEFFIKSIGRRFKKGVTPVTTVTNLF